MMRLNYTKGTVTRRVNRLRSAARTVRKRCQKCGVAAWYRPHERLCKQRVGLRGTYWCYGHLGSVAKEARVARTMTDSDALRAAVAAAAMVDPQTAEAAERTRTDARRKLAHAERMLKEAQADIKRAVTRMQKWQARASYQARRSALTNEEYAAQRRRGGGDGNR